MRKMDQPAEQNLSDLVELGEATKLTQGIAARNLKEALVIEDHKDQA